MAEGVIFLWFIMTTGSYYFGGFSIHHYTGMVFKILAKLFCHVWFKQYKIRFSNIIIQIQISSDLHVLILHTLH